MKKLNGVRASRQTLLGASLITIGSVLFASSAAAQTSADPAIVADTPAAVAEDAAADNGGLGDIVVTARKVEERLQDVPVAITAFSGADLANQNVQKTQDLARFTPGMTVRPGGSSPSALTITLRGQVQADILATLDPSVGTYVDGVYWARAYGLNADLLDVRSVQILKGPQGTLFGRNTTGGALLIQSNDPSLNSFSGLISGTYGRFDERSLTGVVNIPLLTDKAALRVAVMRSLRDGYTHSITNGRDYDARDRWNGRAKLLVEPIEDVSLLFSAEVFDMDERSPGRVILAGLPSFTATTSLYSIGAVVPNFAGFSLGAPAATRNSVGIAALNGEAALVAGRPGITKQNFDAFTMARTYTYNFTGSVDVGFGAIKLITGYRKIKSSSGLDLEGSSFPAADSIGSQALKQYSGELQLTGKALDGAVDFAAGGFLFRESGFDNSVSVTSPSPTTTAIPGTTSVTTNRTYGIIRNNSKGIYGQASWHVTDKLTFTGGLRYSSDEKGLELRNNTFNRVTGIATCALITVPGTSTFVTTTSQVINPVECATKRSDKFDGWSYTAGVDYKPTDDILLYAKTSKGFRAGGQNLRAPSVALFLPFKPEIAFSHEIGFKSQFLDNRVRFNVAAYTTTVKDIQRTTLISAGSGTGTATILGNAGKARFNGVEAELTAQVLEPLRISLTGALVDPKYIEYRDLSGDRSFERFTQISKQSFTAAADYTADIGPAAVRLRVDYSWLSKQAGADYNWVPNPSNNLIIQQTTIKAYGMVGARASASFGDGMYEIAVFGRNLTNNRGIASTLLVAPLGFVSGVRREPATYGVTGTVKF